MIDVMFSQLPGGQSLAYLLMINTLTRYLYAQLLNPVVGGRVQFSSARNQNSFITAFDKMLDGSGLRNFHLIGDADPTFLAIPVQKHLRERWGASFTPVERQQSQFPEWATQENAQTKSEPQHRKLGIIDRVTRTIRDIAFQQHWETISPAEMKWIVNEYNNAPHKTLTELCGFDVSPKIAQNDRSI
jgi:hypothetical protein